MPLSHPAWGAWIEISAILPALNQSEKSHPAWGAWIEIFAFRGLSSALQVAPRMGCVD